MSLKQRLVCDLCERALGRMAESHYEFLIDGADKHMCKHCETILQSALETSILERYLLHTDQLETLIDEYADGC